MSVRNQEQRERQARRRIDKAMRRADREIKTQIEARAREATLRANEVKRRIEKGDVQPRPLPGMREDSMASMESMPSLQSMQSMQSMESADYASGVSEEAQKEVEAGGIMMKDMPLEGQPMDPERAHDDLAQRATEETGSGGDPHLHADRKVDQMAEGMFED
jgi:hypothetical protein